MRRERRARRWSGAAAWIVASAGIVPACGRLGLYERRMVPRDDAGSSDDGIESHRDAAPRRDGARDLDARKEASIDAQRDAHGSVADASTADAIPPPESGPPRDAALGERDGGTSVRDASADLGDAPDAAPDCHCPPDDYFVDANVNGEHVRFTSAYHLGLYCDESEPELAHPPCGSVYRLTACAGPSSEPPCVYVTVDGQSPVIGVFVDATGHTFGLVSGSIVPATSSGRLVTGAFSATYASDTSEAAVTISGTFNACATLFQPCKR